MTVRPATRYDEDAALSAWRACLVARHQPPGPARTTRVRSRLRAADTLSLVAEQDGRVVGLLLAELGRADDGSGPVVPGLLHLSVLAVHPSSHRQGHGRALLEALTARYPWVSAWAAADDEAALGLGLACGFVAAGRTQDRPTGPLLYLEHPPKDLVGR